MRILPRFATRSSAATRKQPARRSHSQGDAYAEVVEIQFHAKLFTLARSPRKSDRFLPTHYSHKMQTNQTTDLDGNEADKTEREQTALIDLRMLIQRLSWPEKIAVAQIACNQIGSRQPLQLVKLHPFGANFGNHLEVASILMAALRAKTLAGVVIEILENPNE